MNNPTPPLTLRQRIKAVDGRVRQDLTLARIIHAVLIAQGCHIAGSSQIVFASNTVRGSNTHDYLVEWCSDVGDDEETRIRASVLDSTTPVELAWHLYREERIETISQEIEKTMRYGDELRRRLADEDDGTAYSRLMDTVPKNMEAIPRNDKAPLRVALKNLLDAKSRKLLSRVLVGLGSLDNPGPAITDIKVRETESGICVTWVQEWLDHTEDGTAEIPNAVLDSVHPLTMASSFFKPKHLEEDGES